MTRRLAITPDPLLRSWFQPRLFDWMRRIRAVGIPHLLGEALIRSHTSYLETAKTLLPKLRSVQTEVLETPFGRFLHCGTPPDSYRLAATKDDTGIAKCG